MDSQLQSQFQKVKSLIDASKSILIATHEKPDGDGIGSSLALAHLFGALGKEYFCFCPDFLPDYLEFLPGSDAFTNALDKTPCDLIFALDYGRVGRLGPLAVDRGIDEARFISIDHHPLHDQRGEIKIILPDFSSTSEIIYWFFKVLDFKISKDIATCILTGILTDTGGFKHAVTSPKILEIAGELIGRGANLSKIAKKTLRESTLHSLKARGVILSRIRLDAESGVAYSWISQRDFSDFSIDFSDLGGIPQMINTASDCRLALFMYEDGPQNIYCSLRSEPFKKTNVSKIAEQFGGGGHCYAAGFTYHGSLKEALESVKKTVKAAR